MAKYDWGDGNGKIHSIPLNQHMADLGQKPTTFAPPPAQPAGAPQKGNPQGYVPPAAPAVPSGGTATVVPDAQYLAEAAQRAHDRQTQIDAYNQQSSQDAQNRDEAIRRLLDKVPDDTDTINTGANKQGLFYSGQLTKKLDDYQKLVTQQQGDITNGYQQREDARVAAKKAIASGAPLEEATAMTQVAQRQLAGDTAAADANALVANAGGAGDSSQASAIKGMMTNTTGNARAGQTFSTQLGAGGSWHVYPSGKRVWVPARR